MNFHRTQFIALGLIVWLARNANAQVGTPTVSVVNSNPQTVTVTVNDTTSGSTIYYTTDGSQPSPTSKSATPGSSILIPQNVTLNVQAYAGTNAPSSVVTSQASSGAATVAGLYHTLFLKPDGTVWATGDNSLGELGNNDTTGATQSKPVQVVVNQGAGTTPLNNIVAIAAGAYQSFAVDSYGYLWAWGANLNNELGIGSSLFGVYAPSLVIDSNGNPLTGFISVATSSDHMLALRNDGSVWAWGSNVTGQAGNGTTSNYVTVPTQVLAQSGQSGYLANIIAIAAGKYFSLALDNSGNVWAWGDSSRVGNMNTHGSTQNYPIQVQSLTSVRAIKAASATGYALLANGTVQSWGDNGRGQLGAGTTTSATILAVPTYNLSNITALDNEGAIDANSNLFFWGDNSYGQLGLGLTGNYSTYPIAVSLSTPLAATLTLASGTTQTVNGGSDSTPLTINAKVGTTAVADGTPIIFGITSGQGVLAASMSSTLFSPILSVTTTGGQASAILQEPTGATNSTSTVVAAGGSGQSPAFTITGVVTSFVDTPTLPQWGLIVMVVMLFLAARSQLLIRRAKVG